MRRKPFIGSVIGVATVGAFGATPAVVRGNEKGRGRGGNGSGLVNAGPLFCHS